MKKQIGEESQTVYIQIEKVIIKEKIIIKGLKNFLNRYNFRFAFKFTSNFNEL